MDCLEKHEIILAAAQVNSRSFGVETGNLRALSKDDVVGRGRLVLPEALPRGTAAGGGLVDDEGRVKIGRDLFQG